MPLTTIYPLRQPQKNNISIQEFHLKTIQFSETSMKKMHTHKKVLPAEATCHNPTDGD